MSRKLPLRLVLPSGVGKQMLLELLGQHEPQSLPGATMRAAGFLQGPLGGALFPGSSLNTMAHPG